MNRVDLGVRAKAIWRGGRERCVSSGGGGGSGGGVERETRPLIRGGGVGGGVSLPPVSDRDTARSRRCPVSDASVTAVAVPAVALSFSVRLSVSLSVTTRA